MIPAARISGSAGLPGLSLRRARPPWEGM
jgi:hypothetical protein